MKVYTVALDGLALGELTAAHPRAAANAWQRRGARVHGQVPEVGSVYTVSDHMGQRWRFRVGKRGLTPIEYLPPTATRDAIALHRARAGLPPEEGAR